MDNLLTLISTERARELRLRPGAPPVVVLEAEEHPLEGPPITAEMADHLLRSIANSRQMRELRDYGGVIFVHYFRGTSPFLVHARMEGNNVVFGIT